jgi:ribosomal protein S6
MKLYELSYLISSDSPDEEIKSLQERINNFIIENKGTLERVEDINKKRLAKPVKNQDVAYLANLIFYLDPEKINNLNQKLKSEGRVINFILLNKIPHKVIEMRRRPRIVPESVQPALKTAEKPKKVEIKEIEKKLEEILGE